MYREMYAVYTVHQDVDTVAYKSGILYIQKHDVKLYQNEQKWAFGRVVGVM